MSHDAILKTGLPTVGERCFRRGFLVIKAAFLNHLPLPEEDFFPES